MKKITLALFCLSVFFSFSQTLNQPANWPNANWTLDGNYIATSDALEGDPTTSNSFSYNDDAAGQGHQDNISAESPVINLTAANSAGENWVTVGTSYVYRALGDQLQLQYWDADSASWVDWGDAFTETTNNISDNFCSGTAVSFNSSVLNISSFTTNQLSNFRYRFYYDDAQVGGFWGWGFCIQSPTISSQTPPACPNISELTVTNVTVNSANAYWQAGGSESNWEVALQASGSGIPSGSGTSTTSNNPYPLTGLTPGTNYEIYVRGFCGGSDYSNWIGPIAFSTLNPARVNFTTESMSIGGYDLTVVDMDGDHLDDIVSASTNNVNVHYQLSTGGFNEVNISTPSANYLPGWSMAAADFDRNGKTDLLYAAGNGVTFMKQNASGTGFTEISTSEYVFSQRSNFADINDDGHLDAFVCHDVEPNVYYINDGSGNLTFYQSNVTPGAPVNLGDYASGGNYGSIWIDYDNDRDLDMFIAKCGGETARRRNNMLTNNGNNTYTENAAALGLDDPMQTWSSSWGDFDNDGDMDLFVGASSGNHKLMRNNMDGTFTDVTAGSGVSVAPTGHENVSYDIDNDGYLDILCNGTILYGKGDLTFEDADSNQLDYKNGSFGDLNSDGFIDAYYNGNIYWNLTTPNNWITINTVGVQSNIDGIGARVELYTNAGVQIRDVRSGEGFEFMSTLNTHFGIGTETSINSVVIYWPSGVIDTISNPDINEPLEVIEGATLTLENSFVNDLILYPNPTKDVLNISTIDELHNAVYTIFDINGKRVLNSKLNQNTIDVRSLNTGNYILRIVSGNTIKSQKFIKQ
ncbi:FG-GAP-like repeat-containing protein [Psychroserpens sp. SPM9]|uniref:FG-GAP-like repeat-containing protein n=1 Tax=Psychroserpens sp. SPM9 TaxID=2975598 RepID=UPI0021A27E3E|nr:FG-GAP-like repeat-containing protein [Psychroserpens sp. SPM9]MDG5490993.1 FG-GAP-like repeat-containing protein [Psychroserpens sp. SPM9]